MPRRSKIAQYPKAVRDWLEQLVIARNFSGYEQFTKDAAARLKELGLPAFGKSAAHRFGSKLEAKMAAMQDTSQAMITMADAFPDDAGKRSTATLAMVEMGLFDVMYLLRQADATTDPAERIKLLSRAGKTISDLTRAGVTLKKYQAALEEQVRVVAANAAKIGKKGGLSASAIDAIRREILGIAQKPKE